MWKVDVHDAKWSISIRYAKVCNLSPSIPSIVLNSNSGRKRQGTRGEREALDLEGEESNSKSGALKQIATIPSPQMSKQR